MAVLIARHGERYASGRVRYTRLLARLTRPGRLHCAHSIDFVDSSWVDSAERPFDPPLTAQGVKQGRALGRRLRTFSPPVSKIFVSPLGRTVQARCAAVPYARVYGCG